MATEPQQSPAQFWAEHYGHGEPVWSGQVNSTVAELVSPLPPGRSLDLGCGEGGDVIWLAQRGWQAVGWDLSEVAVQRARQAAAKAALMVGSARFEVVDLDDWSAAAGPDSDEVTFDLVTACFLQSPVALARNRILRRAAQIVASGGHLLIVAHASAPTWAEADGPRHTHGHGHGHGHGSVLVGQPHPEFPTPTADLETAISGESGWEEVVVDVRARDVTSPAGQVGSTGDSVVFLRRR